MTEIHTEIIEEMPIKEGEEEEEYEKNNAKIHNGSISHGTLKTSMETDGAETGYVSDSSLNSRKGAPPTPPPKLKIEDEDRLHRPNRKTKSERDKRRSSRISLLESNHDSGSEQSTSSLESQPRYRKRANSKRHEAAENKENIPYRKRASSKNSPQLNRIDSIDEPDTIKEEEAKKKLSIASTATLKMNSKDIYFGTWNPKERAVLDQVLNNIDLTPDDTRKSFRDKSKRGNRDNNNQKKEDVVLAKTEKRKSFFGGFFKKMFHKPERIDEVEDNFVEDPLQDYMISTGKKKKSIFRRSRIFSKNNHKKDDFVPRRRAQSSNDYGRSVAAVMDNTRRTNLSKKRSGSTQSLKALFSRAKSVDNLHGAFDYFANNDQIFKRTPSMKNLEKFTSNENLSSNLQRSGSQKSLSHGFEPVRLTSRDLCYNDSMVYAHAKMIMPSTASQRSLNVQPPGGRYDSAYEEDYYRGYQSDYAPASTPASACPTLSHYHSDVEYFSLRPNPSTPPSRHHGHYQPPPRRLGGYYPPPPQPQHHHHHGYYQPPPPPPPHHPHHGYQPPSYNYSQNRIPPGYATPGYGSPCMTPENVTPRRGYYSECDSGQSQPSTTPQLSHVPFHARRAIQRSVSKSSATSYQSYNGYLSESSYCEEDDVFTAGGYRSPKLHRNFSRSSQHSQMSTVL